jgi:hypothetical protein
MSDQPLEEATLDRSVLSEGIGARGPNVIGATGGSGTRVVAKIVRAGGMFIGEKLNPYEDAVDFGAYSDRWIDRYFPLRRRGEDVPQPMAEEMTSDLRSLVESHCADLPAAARCWGWKEPRSIYLVPFLRARMPSLRFLHFVRDGRDMAFSQNQQQLKKHGRAVLEGRTSWRRPVRSIALWNRVNLLAADYGERELGDDYRRVRFEDLCAQPAETISLIYEFFGLEGDLEAAAAEVRPPDTLGRWRESGKRLVASLQETGEPALRRFGYL